MTFRQLQSQIIKAERFPKNSRDFDRRSDLNLCQKHVNLTFKPVTLRCQSFKAEKYPKKIERFRSKDEFGPSSKTRNQKSLSICQGRKISIKFKRFRSKVGPSSKTRKFHLHNSDLSSASKSICQNLLSDLYLGQNHVNFTLTSDPSLALK